MWRQLERAETAGNVASILADLLGVQSRAANWAVAARVDWACYAVYASRQLQPR